MGGSSTMQTGGESGGYLYGYEINPEGMIRLPAVGLIKVKGLSMEAARDTVQNRVDKVVMNTVVECKLLSFKFTVLGEVAAPGNFMNSSSYLTVLDAVGHAGGLNDFGKRTRVLVIRNDGNSTKTYRLSLQDKNILSSEAYYIYPNDVLIVEPNKQKIFSQNQSIITFIVSTVTSTITMTLLLINYLK
jgi:polysaccharide export outer membrane protein